MEQEQRKEIEEIVNQFKCPREIRCCKSDFKVLCRVEDIGLQTYMKCLEENPQSCPASLPFADGYFCECPLRIHIAKELKI